MSNDISVFQQLKKYFKKTKDVAVGDIGIYQYIWSIDTYHDTTHSIKYDVFAKVKALEVYDNLIEIQLLNLKITDFAPTEVTDLITKNFPMYINKKHVKWQIK